MDEKHPVLSDKLCDKCGAPMRRRKGKNGGEFFGCTNYPTCTATKPIPLGITSYEVNFAQFVEWPADAFSDAQSPLVIGILGQDPFGDFLDQTVQGEVIRGRSYRIERYRQIDEIRDCQILFISRSESKRLKNVLAVVKDRPTTGVATGDQRPSAARPSNAAARKDRSGVGCDDGAHSRKSLPNRRVLQPARAGPALRARRPNPIAQLAIDAAWGRRPAVFPSPPVAGAACPTSVLVQLRAGFARSLSTDPRDRLRSAPSAAGDAPSIAGRSPARP